MSMKDITYKNTHNFSKKQLQELFLSNDWDSGNYPEKLVTSMKNFSTVFSAWDNDELVGLISVMDDGIMNAYINYILVKPEYQLKGIGKTLIGKVKSHYKDYQRIALITMPNNSKFYEYCGFEKREDKIPFFITKLKD